MARNGKRRQRRPRIELVTPASSPQEAAAVIAGIERFIADTAPPPPAPGSHLNPWQRAALHEGVGAKAFPTTPWGDPSPWGSRQ